MVVFHPLTQEQIGVIVGIQLEFLSRRLAERDMHLELTAPAVAKLAEAGYDPVYGARPLKRAIQQRVENPLAQEILQGSLTPGDTVTVDVEDDQIVILKATPAAA
jgi:ATP-dependent Clp protease ATP-binding subunit ClpB